MIMFPATSVANFRRTNLALRYGQEFHQYMKLEKVTDPKDKLFCDRLFNANDKLAKKMITSRTDNNG